jgi:acyl-[acyl-carrier-protein]-phospholipid O-acyltransferase/long-chain-fatty-acid--[acyl-carrier-protein] ligase
VARGLLSARRFAPFLLLQALGALGDNLYKNALAVAVVLRAGTAGPMLVAAAGGIFILPFLLFSAPAGALADRFDKVRLVRLCKLAELALMAAGAVALIFASDAALLAVLFALGVQAAFFGPVKYAIVPELVGAEETAAATGWIEATTYLAILIGSVAGPALMALPAGARLVGLAVVAFAAVGVAAAFRLPSLAAPGIVLDRQGGGEIAALFAHARATPLVWVAILGLSWFWAVGAVFVTEFPALAMAPAGNGAGPVALLLAAFALGVGAGSVATGRLARGNPCLGVVPWALLAMALFIAEAAFAAARWAHDRAGGDPRTLASPFDLWHLLAVLFCLAAAGGVVSVLLYGVLQRTPGTIRARMLAANNIVNAAFMVAASVALMAMHALGLAAPAIFTALAALALAVALAAFHRVSLSTDAARSAR